MIYPLDSITISAIIYNICRKITEIVNNVIKNFYAKPNWIKRGWGKYCSKKCQYEAQKNGKTVECFICDKKVYKSSSALSKSKSKKYFCSRSCQTKWRNKKFIGRKHANYKDGKNSYRALMIRKSDPICLICKNKDLRILVVHHIDEDRKNNKIDNLAWLCRNCHYLVHNDIKVEKKFLKLLN